MSQAGSASALPVALIGCGAVAEILYRPTLDRLAREGLVQVAAVVDRDLRRAGELGTALGCPDAFPDLDAMLARVQPRLAIVAAPHRFHEEICLRLAQAGVHILCEKPLAVSPEAGERMVRAARQAGVILAAGHFRRFFPASRMIKAILEQHLLGAPRSFRFLEGEAYSWPARSASFFKKKEAGGGVLIDAGAHTLDLLLWWLGGVAELEYEDDAMGGVEANCHLRLRLQNGAAGSIRLSRDWPLPNRYVITCERGSLTYICDGVDRFEWSLDGIDFAVDSQLRTLTAAGGLGSAPGFMDCFADQLRNVVDAVAHGSPVAVPGAEALAVVSLIDRCYRQRRLLPMPWLPPVEIAAARELSHA